MSHLQSSTCYSPARCSAQTPVTLLTSSDICKACSPTTYQLHSHSPCHAGCAPLHWLLIQNLILCLSTHQHTPDGKEPVSSSAIPCPSPSKCPAISHPGV